VRIAVTGKEGQVVRSLIERSAAAGHDIVTVGRPEIDLAGEPDSIVPALEAATPDVIVSSAAYTAVDRAESERDIAFAINQRGAAAVAQAAAKLAVPLIHLSTDYVFDGTKRAPYVETDETGPASVYGASKLAGEQAVVAAHANAAVLRTAWVYSPFGANFVKTMLRLAGDIADGILGVASNLTSSQDAALRGTFHMTAKGEATWADFAEAIFEASAKAGGPRARVRRITTADYPTPARRPANSRLDSTKLEQAHCVRLPDWSSSLPQVVRRLVAATTQMKVSQG
jgi:dTDP-4-dehydrorhamnose reductase